MKKLFTLFLAFFCLIAFSCQKTTVTINKVEDLSNKKIGVQSGTTGETYVQENFPKAKISSFKTGMDAALDLKNGAIDAVILDELPAKEIVSKNPALTIIDVDLTTEAYAIAVKKDNTELLNSINATIATMRTNGDYEKLVNSFMPIDGKIIVPQSLELSGEKTIRLGTNAAFPPFEYVDGKNIVGFDITMGQYIAKDFATKLEIVDMAFDSLIPALASGTIDFIAAGMSVTEERKKNVDFSDPYYESKQVIIIRNDTTK
ncbi:MAG: transporter substrate-binding domain-containing protein [Treponema sp.]|jgi:polar amino acid transport system substrate-binding protein|nr:transporter substrate-binding domain-containing protein [Treponema sp.]